MTRYRAVLLLVVVALSSICATAQVSLSPTSLSFGNQVIGTTSASRNITLTNSGTSAVTVNSITTTNADFIIASNGCGASVGAGQKCTLGIAFKPSNLGTETATLTVNDTAPKSPQTVALSGSGILPVSVSPTSISFGSTAVGNTSAASTVTVTNNQVGPLAISTIAISAGFISSTTCPSAPATLGAGASCTVSASSQPVALGTYSGTVTVTDSASNSPQTVSLSGSGIAPATLTPGTLSFGNQLVGTTSRAKDVTLTNKQNVALTISGITVSGDFVIQSTTTCPTSGTVAIGHSCVIAVAFKPTSQGIRTGNLGVASSAVAPYDNLSAPLSGNGTATLQSIAVTPTSPSVPKGATQQFTAIGTYSDGTTKDLTSTVTWTSSKTTVATITTGGLATALAQGSTTIKAASGGISGTTAMTVMPGVLISIAVTPASPTIPLGTTKQFTATGTYSDGSTQNLTSTAVWSSSAAGFASISSTGLATSHAVGATTITASSGTVSGETTLTVSPAVLVSLSVTPTSASVPLGTSEQFTATGTFTDGSTSNVTNVVAWTSSVPSVATINPTGLAASQGTGNTNLQASAGSVISNSASLTVLPAALQSIEVTPVNASIVLGTTQQFTATGTFTDGSTQDLTSSVTWSSSNTAVASISARGLASSVSVGNTTIFATAASVTGSTALTVSPAQLVSIAITPAIPSIPLGTTQQFTATGTFTDHTTQDLTATVHWSSSVATVATIGDSAGTNGLASSLGTGTTSITAISGSSSGSTSLTVTPAALVSIAVTPANPSIALGTTQQFTATGTYTDSTTQNLTSTATWASSSTAVVTVASMGLAHSAAIGSATISASVGSVSGTTTLTVTPAALVSITVMPASPSIPLGTTQQFTATGNYTDGSTQDLTIPVHWSTSDGTVATISNATSTNGIATSVAFGTVTISATDGSITGAASLSITSATLVSIGITPQNPSIPLGRSQQFTATGTYIDESTKDITTNVTWTSSLATVAVISNNTGSQGLAVSSGEGSATITATRGSVSANTTLTVGLPQLVSIAVTPANPSIPLGTGQQFTATGTYTDSSTTDLTSSATWSSSNTSVATVAAGSATGVGQGSTTITATSGAISGGTTLTVASPVVTSLRISLSNPSVPLGLTQQFTATAVYSDSSTQDVSSSAIWTSLNTAVANVSSIGLASTIAQGSATIQATYKGLTATTTLTVNAPGLVSIIVTPTGTTVSAGSYVHFTATGTYTNGSSANISNLVSWSSSNTSVATIDATGLAHILNTGAVTIIATSGVLQGTASLTAVTASWNLIQHPKAFTCTSTNCSVTTSPTTAGSLLVLWSAVRYLGKGYSKLTMVNSVTDNGTAETWMHCPNSMVNDAYSSDGVVFALDCWYVPKAAGGATSVTAQLQLGGFTSPSQQVDLALQEYSTPGTVYYDTGNGRIDSTSCSSCTGAAGLLSGTSDLVTQAAIYPIDKFASGITGISSPYSSLFDTDTRIYAAFSGATGQSSYSVPTWTSVATGSVTYHSMAAFSTNSSPTPTGNMIIDFSGCTSGAAPTTTCMANSTFSGWGSSQDTSAMGAGVKICTSGPTSNLPAPVTVDGAVRVGNGSKNLCATTNSSGTGIGRYVIGLNGAYAPMTVGYTFRSTCPASRIDCGALLRLGDAGGGYVTVHINPLGAGNICLESVNGGSCQDTGVAYVAGKDYRFNVQGAGVSGTVDRLTVCDDATGAVLGTATATSTANPGGYHSVEPGISGEEPNVAGYNYYFRNIVLGGKYSTTGCF